MENTEWLISEWNVNFADVMQAMADVKPQMEFAVMDSIPQAECLWWKQPFSIAQDSPFWVGAPELTWSAIGQLVLTSAGVEGSPAAEARSTYSEIIGQSMGGLAREISQRVGNEVTADGGTEAPLETPGPTRMFHVTAKFTDQQPCTFYVVISEDLAAALTAATQAEGNSAADTPEQPQEPTALSNDIAHVAKSRTFELLLDVELPISVSFGRTSLRVQDAINLVSGSLIELDRNVSDPVELIVNNSVIARGEVVVIEGNYGIRLTEIVSHKERLQQSRRYMLS